MAYSTIDECRRWVSKALTTEDIADAKVTALIADADKKVREDLSKLIDVSLIPDVVDVPPTPEWINEMSRYKTNELVLVSLFGVNREDINTDVKYWKDEYNTKLEQAQNGEFDLGDLALATQTFTGDSKKDVTPALGDGFYGGHLDEDNLEDVREEGLPRAPDRDT